METRGVEGIYIFYLLLVWIKCHIGIFHTLLCLVISPVHSFLWTNSTSQSGIFLFVPFDTQLHVDNSTSSFSTLNFRLYKVLKIKTFWFFFLRFVWFCTNNIEISLTIYFKIYSSKWFKFVFVLSSWYSNITKGRQVCFFIFNSKHFLMRFMKYWKCVVNCLLMNIYSSWWLQKFNPCNLN